MDDNFEDIFNRSLSPPGHTDTDFHFDYEDEDNFEDFMGTQHTPRPPLRSRPPIDFTGAGRFSTIKPHPNLPAFNATTRPPSHMSDTTLHSSLGYSAAHTFPHKTSSSPGLSSDAIATLTVAKLCYNPHYLKLREKFNQVCRALAMKTIDRELAEPPANTLFLDGCQAPPLHTKGSCASSLGPRSESRASSLGPSDSASQQMKFDPTYDKAIKTLLGTVEPLPTRPQFLPREVLWYYDDCATDKSYGDIVTKSNMYRLKMNLAIRRLDGSKVSAQEFSNIRHSVAIVIQKLINLIDSDPRMAVRAGDPKSRTRSFIKNLFKPKYDRAILELEAEQRLLRLCYAHWKADVLIGQVQKRSKDGIAPSVQKTVGPSVPANCKYAIRRSLNTNSHLYTEPQHTRKLVPTFLNRTEVTNGEPASMNLHPVFVDPSADNLIAVLTSNFPSLTNTVALIRSMNAQMSFKQGKASDNVTTLLERVQFADPGSPDINEDNMCLSWGHDLFTAGGVSPSSSLTTWENVGSVATTFKLVAAALKMCQEVWLMCVNVGTPKTSGFISDVYLEKILECLQNCWVGAGGAITPSRVPVLPITPPTPSYRDVAMSPPKHALLLKIKRPTPIANAIAPISTPETSTEDDSTSAQQPAASTEPTQGASVPLDEGTRADAASLRLLQVSELLNLISDNKLGVPKSRRKDELIATIVNSPEFVRVSKSAIQEIVKNRKVSKGSKQQLAALP
ncbi:hypothetical protein H4582DRAFT_2057868 [Lactarius indigo]|nr:hypothetical protein H4582DRAFT_2057868 [Lactarius indigo]